MQHIEGKKKLLDIAKKLIMEKGYDAISARKIARDANMSIGTLYYHFPHGKVSILYDLMESLQAEFLEINKFSNIIKLSTNPELTEFYLKTLIKAVREYAPLIKGFHVELLTNKEVLNSQKNLQENRQVEIASQLSDFIETNIPEFVGKEKKLGVLARIIINTVFQHVIMDNFYGTDEELKEVLIQLINNFFSKSKN